MQGTLFIISAPSGAGKSSLIAALLKRFNLDDRLRLSVSHTTRAPRPGEIDHVSYHFVGEEEFKAQIDRGAFYEYAKVFDHYYGTSREIVESWLNEGKDVLLDIDWQGARQIRAQCSAVRSVFILPPSLEELRRRLIARGQDSEEIIAARMQKACAESSHYGEYDYVIVNDNFDESVLALHSIVLCQRLGVLRQESELRALYESLSAGREPA